MIGGFILPSRQPLLNQQHIHLQTFFCRRRVWIVPRIGRNTSRRGQQKQRGKICGQLQLSGVAPQNPAQGTLKTFNIGR